MKKVLGLATLLALMTPVPGVAKDSWYDGIYIGFGGGAGRLEADLNKLGLLPQDTGESIESNDSRWSQFHSPGSARTRRPSWQNDSVSTTRIPSSAR